MGIDRPFRAAWAHLVAATLPRPGGDALALARRVVVLRHDAIGDMLSSLGLLRALVTRGLEVDVVASRANASVLAANPWGVRVHLDEPGRLARRMLGRTLAARRYDVAIDALVLKPSVNTRTVRLLRMSRAPVRIGTLGRAHDVVYTHGVTADLAANHVQVLAALVQPFGIDPASALDPVAMPLTTEERSRAESWWARGAGPRLFANLSASSAERRWPDERFVEALRTAAREMPGMQVAISARPDEWPSAKAIAAATGGRAVQGSLRDAFALLSTAHLVLTPDTSVAHAAAGFQVPSVVMTPAGNLRFSPWRAPCRLVVSPGPSLESVTVAEVLEALVAIHRDT